MRFYKQFAEPAAHPKPSRTMFQGITVSRMEYFCACALYISIYNTVLRRCCTRRLSCDGTSSAPIALYMNLKKSVLNKHLQNFGELFFWKPFLSAIEAAVWVLIFSTSGNRFGLVLQATISSTTLEVAAWRLRSTPQGRKRLSLPGLRLRVF